MSLFDYFPLELKIVIASYLPETWYVMWKYDEAFNTHACTMEACRLYISLFTVIKSDSQKIETYLFNRLQSIYDQPAVIHPSGRRDWYQNGKRHRDNDQPTIICADGTQYYI